MYHSKVHLSDAFRFKSFYIFFIFSPRRISERSVLMPRQAEEALQYDDFLGWTVSSLKDFLSLRGLKQTDRKSELVSRAFGAYELNVLFAKCPVEHMYVQFVIKLYMLGVVTTKTLQALQISFVITAFQINP